MGCPVGRDVPGGCGLAGLDLTCFGFAFDECAALCDDRQGFDDGDVDAEPLSFFGAWSSSAGRPVRLEGHPARPKDFGSRLLLSRPLLRRRFWTLSTPPRCTRSCCLSPRPADRLQAHLSLRQPGSKRLQCPRHGRPRGLISLPAPAAAAPLSQEEALGAFDAAWIGRRRHQLLAPPSLTATDLGLRQPSSSRLGQPPLSPPRRPDAPLLRSSAQPLRPVEPPPPCASRLAGR